MQETLEKNLTKRRGPSRVIPDMADLNPFQQYIQDGIGEGAVGRVATHCGIDRWILDDLFRKGTVPRDEALTKICDGLGLDKATAVLLIHGLEAHAPPKRKVATA